MDPATASSVDPVTLTDSSSAAREATEESRTGTATLARGQVAKSTSESTVTPLPARPLSYVEHTQVVESGTGSSSQADHTPPATRPTSDPALRTLERHLSSNTDGPYPARCSRNGTTTHSGEFDYLARGTSKGRDFLPRRATLLSQEYPSLPANLVPKTTLQPDHTAGERLQPTIDAAEHEKAKCAAKAKWTSYALNIAIGLQVLLGSLTTGLSAIAVNGKQSAVATVILGALATLVASYLARMRGSNEPELSITRVKDLDQFLRDCKTFQLDHGYTYGTAENGLDKRVEEFRSRFEELLGNGDGQRKLSPV
ncbi:hypothetical protein BD769DRAFT_1440087 [Suillus cothurnatus]|nr:hypothetical protein BD769DRAFT_1440087 [Suillus cothurnatus]